MAGKRLGKEDDRHLWPEMLRAIREIQPRWVVGENVFGLVNWSGGLVFHEVQTDLEAAGYEVFPYVLPAAAVNAPHRRDRVWFVAYSNGNGCNQCNSDNEINPSERGFNAFSNTNASNGNGDVTDTDNTRFKTFNNKKSELGKKNRTKTFSGNNIKSIYSRTGWKNFPTQSPICDGNDGISARLDGITFSKWRNESIKAGGNAIVPNVVFQIFKAIEQYELLTAPATDTRQ
jgi:DNA (cytosine-5)-methyltransferase 1